MKKGLTSTVAMMALVTSMFAEGVLREDLQRPDTNTEEVSKEAKNLCKGDFQLDPLKTFYCIEALVKENQFTQAKELSTPTARTLINNKIWAQLTGLGKDNFTDTKAEMYVVCPVQINKKNSSKSSVLIERQCYTPNSIGGGTTTLKEEYWGRHGFFSMTQDPNTKKWYMSGYLGK